jgi:hypothetical protein
MGLSKPYLMSEESGDDDDDEKDDDSSTRDDDESKSTNTVTDDGKLKDVLEALAQMDIVLSDDTTGENFLNHLHQALLTAAAHRGEDVKPNESASNTNDKTTVADPGIAALSLEARGAIAWAERTHREQVTNRLRKLLDEGQCTPAEHKARSEHVAAIKLSLDASGQPAPSDLEKWIESREAVPRGTFWDPDTKTKKMSLTSVADPPKNLTGDFSQTDVDETVKWALGKK